MANTYYAQNVILNYIFGKNTTIVIPSTWYLGLSTNTPNEVTGSVTEVSGVGYARASIANVIGTNGWIGASNGETGNRAFISFPIAGSSWGTVTNLLVYDSPTGGNLWFYQILDTPVTISQNDQVGYLSNTVIMYNHNP